MIDFGIHVLYEAVAMVYIISGADFVQGLIGIFKERHQTNLARIVIFCFLRMSELVPLSESEFGQFRCSSFFFFYLFLESLLFVVLDFDSSLFVFFNLNVHQPLHEQVLMLLNLIIHRWSRWFDLVASLLLQENYCLLAWEVFWISDFLCLY